MERISGADLLGMRAHAKEAENYVLSCSAYVDKLTRVHVAMQIEVERLREALRVVDLNAGGLIGQPVTDIERGLVQIAHAARLALTPNV